MSRQTERRPRALAARRGNWLDRRNRCGTRAFALLTAALFDGVFDLLALGQMVELSVLDGRMMEEDISAVASLNETESLVMHEFLDRSRSHKHKLPC